MNILENAINACSQNQAEKSPEILFRVKAHEKKIIVEISDNGIGMDRETQERIFTPFFSSKGSKGTGLGLFVSNTIIQQHGGVIDVKSTVGEGTLFSITIPKMLPESVKVANGKTDTG